MSTVVIMSQTVGALTSGQTYVVRSRNAETLVANSQATKSGLKVSAAGVPPTRTGK